MTPRDLIANRFLSYSGLAAESDHMADLAIAALSAAGFALYDTKTHVAVPREPTEKMIGAAAYEGRYVTFAKTYRAMLAAAGSDDGK